MSDARWEFEQVAFSAVEEALGKAGVQPRQVGVLIVNCSLFNPTPSLSAMIMNHFKVGVGGRGCVVCGCACCAACRSPRSSWRLPERASRCVRGCVGGLLLLLCGVCVVSAACC